MKKEKKVYKENCRHERADSAGFVDMQVDLRGDLYEYISDISKNCGYTIEVVLGVLIAVGMRKERDLEEAEEKRAQDFALGFKIASQATSPRKSKPRQPKLSKKPAGPKTKPGSKRKPK